MVDAVGIDSGASLTKVAIRSGNDTVHRVLPAGDALPAEQREAFVLQQEGGLSIEEIAETTGVTRETAKSRLRYALAKLRQGELWFRNAFAFPPALAAYQSAPMVDGRRSWI